MAACYLIATLLSTTWWVSPGGSDGDSSPWSLSYALSGPALLRNGDTVRFAPGDYDCSDTCSFPPIGVTWDGHHDARFIDNREVGGYSWRDSTVALWGGVTLSRVAIIRTTRRVHYDVSDGEPPFGISVHGPSTIYGARIDGSGIGVFVGAHADGTVVADSIITDIGWNDGAKGHGHGLYLQGATTASRNIIRKAHGYCIQVWGSGNVSGQRIDSNILASCGRGGIVIGGGDAHDISIEKNAYHWDSSPAQTALQIAGSVTDLYVRGNAFVGVIQTTGSMPVSFEDNLVFGRGGRSPGLRLPVVNYTLPPSDECDVFCAWAREHPNNVYLFHSGTCDCGGMPL